MKSEIVSLKKDLNAVFLVHNYQRPEIQDLADYVGDSLELCKKAQTTNADYILFCGVDFMAECAALLNPDKTVLIPDETSRCPMAAMLPPSELKQAKEEHPNAESVVYINTLAATKAEADLVCTSANSVDMINSLESDTVLFGPDQNMAWFAQKHTSKKIISVPENGYCLTHHLRIRDSQISELKSVYPDAVVFAHPECTPSVQELSDYVLGTGDMLKKAKELSTKQFIIATEKEMCYRLKKENPSKEFYAIPGAECIQMKKHTLSKMKVALENPVPITVDKKIAERACLPIQKMIELSK